jgi:GH24 family phage-related lysozyme (muramidase)
MSGLTPKVVAYLGTEEGLVPEAYLDSKNIWTWSMGIATTGGNDVLQFKDKPQTLTATLAAALGLIRAKYLPPVLRAFAGHTLTENQIAAALSFEWRNGTILTAQWVKDFVAGDIAAARKDIMNWTDHGRQVPRATRERDLFFDAQWPADLRVPVYAVAKPSHKPSVSHLVDVLPILQHLMGAQ